MRTRSQRLLSMVLALSMLLTFLPVSAFAESTPPYAASNADKQTLDKNNTYEDDSGNKYVYTLNSDGTTATLLKFTGEDADVPSSVEKKWHHLYRHGDRGECVCSYRRFQQTNI